MSIISKTYGKAVIFSLIAIVPLLLISNSVLSFGQTNTTNSTTTTSSNQTNPAAASGNPNSEIIKSIDSGISMIKSGDNDGSKKALYQAEASLEDQPNQGGADGVILF